MIKTTIKSGYEKLKVFLENKSNRNITVLGALIILMLFVKFIFYKDLS